MFAGDFDGDGRASYGEYLGGTFRLVNTLGDTFVSNYGDLGVSGDLPLVGDWDGDGVDSLGYGSGY
jgi:alkaline phosphatase